MLQEKIRLIQFVAYLRRAPKYIFYSMLGMLWRLCYVVKKIPKEISSNISFCSVVGTGTVWQQYTCTNWCEFYSNTKKSYRLNMPFRILCTWKHFLRGVRGRVVRVVDLESLVAYYPSPLWVRIPPKTGFFHVTRVPEIMNRWATRCFLPPVKLSSYSVGAT